MGEMIVDGLTAIKTGYFSLRQGILFLKLAYSLKKKDSRPKVTVLFKTGISRCCWN
jgi:hypothetical protein